MSAKLVFISSAGHSGSTLLDLVVGSIPTCFSTGELTWLPWQLYRGKLTNERPGNQEICSCGQEFADCEIWSKIIDKISVTRGIDFLRNPYDFKINLLQDKKFETSRFLLSRFHRAAYSLANRNKILLPLRSLYRMGYSRNIENNWHLFDTIADCLGIDHVVDSSKNIGRMSLLYQRRPEDVYLIVLIRDIRANAFSDQKRGFDPLRRARSWVEQYNNIYRNIKNLPDIRFICVKYERLASEPEKERLRVARFLGCPDVQRDFRLDTRKTHPVAGNQMRYSGEIEIRLDEAWKTGLSAATLDEINKISQRLHPFWTNFLEE